ncbi:hypothetical protein BX600DRAFT_516155 [Xylariales sp. PMI_506]|nr:hypothetical protein BX600DRAFT_516155 [Xylariales sp. PMI_506]
MKEVPQYPRQLGLSGSPSCLAWGQTFTTAAAGAVLSATTIATAASGAGVSAGLPHDELGASSRQHICCEANTVLGRPNLDLWHSDMATTDTAPESRACPSIPPSFPQEACSLVATESPNKSSQFWSPHAMNSYAQMVHYTPYHHPYTQDSSLAEFSPPEYSPPAALPYSTPQTTHYLNPMVLPPQADPMFNFDTPLPTYDGSAYPLDPSSDFFPVNLSPEEVAVLSDDSDWTPIQQPDSSGDDVGQLSSEEPSSAGTSPPGLPLSPGDNKSDNYVMLSRPTDNMYEVSADGEKKYRYPRKKYGKGPDSRKGGRKAPLNATQRERASNTRRMTACIRCQMQRIACVPDPDAPDPARGVCQTCSSVGDSKKVIHRLPCVRWKLTSTCLFRSGGLKFTNRPGWDGTVMRDLGEADWADGNILTIQVSLGLCSSPIELNVRKFNPRPGDVLPRFWKDRYGNQRTTYIEPYALANIDRSAQTFQQHITLNAFDAVGQYANNPDVHELVRKTYKAAWNHMNNSNHKCGGVDARTFMKDLFVLWFATRNTLGSSAIVGPEKLGMVPDDHEDYPLKGQINVPRMICQQFDQFNFTKVLYPQRKKVLTNLWKLMQSKNAASFYTIYLAVFILLHEASATSKDRYWHARNKVDVNARYDMEKFMEELQEGTNIILLVWHYYKRGLNPEEANWDKLRVKQSDKNIFRDIGPQEQKLMRSLADVTQKGKIVPETPKERSGLDGVATNEYPLIWERDLHFVSQMFKEDWQPTDTWHR